MAAPSVTYTFSNSTTADATQVNQNFTDIINGVSDGTKDLSINALTCAGTATLNGNINLGNNSSDDLTITASIASSLSIKTTFSYDLGTSTVGWKSVYFGSNDSAARTVRIIAGAIGTSYTITLPTGVSAGAGYVLKSTTGGVTSWASSTVENVTSQTTTYTALITDDVITVTTASAWTLTLPAASTATGKILKIKKTSSDFNALTIDGNASETIDGSTTTTIDTQYESIQIICDGSNWHIIERCIPSIWTAYTPTGNWNSNVAFSGYYKRIGDSLALDLAVQASGAPGTVSGGGCTFTIPSGLTMDTNKMASASTNGYVNHGSGGCYDSSDGQAYVAMPGYASTTTVNLMCTASATPSKTQALSTSYPFTVASGDVFYCRVIVPITGWKG